MATTQQHIDRIRADVPVVRVLADLGYSVRPDGGQREQQFSCDLHGDGRDHKPSARVYPDSASWYCFACSISRDAIDTIQAKKGLGLKAAIRYLETNYNLPDLPWEDEGTEETTPHPHRILRHALDAERSFVDYLKVLYTTLNWVTRERALPMSSVVAFWEAVDQIAYRVKEGVLLENKGRLILAEIQRRLDEVLTPHAEPA